MKLVNINEWKPFKIENLFTKLELKNNKKDFKKAFDISAIESEEFNLPLVNAKHSNNGIMYYGRNSDFDSAEMTIDIVADGAASTGDVYAQPQRTGVLYNAYLIKPVYEKISKYSLLFLATVIGKSIKEYFGYENKCTWDRVKEMFILLPAKDDENPDYRFMEQYMQELEKLEKNKIECFEYLI